MPSSPILVTSAFLFAQRERWGADFELIGPERLSAALPVGLLKTIRVIVSDGETLDPCLVDALPNLQLVACFSTGYSGIDTAQLHRRGIALTTGAGVNAHDVADHAFALLLGLWNRVVTADRNVREGLWRQGIAHRASLRGRSLGILGLGRIGRHLAHRGDAFGLKVRWWGPVPKPDVAYERAVSIEALARDSDILVIACRDSANNRGFINTQILNALGSQGLLVNVARGALINEPDLLSALREGRIAGAALDVFSHEPPDAQVWASIPNVMLSPHIAGFTREAGIDLFGQLHENIRRHFAGEPLLTPVVASRG